MRRILLVVVFASGCAFDPSGREMAEGPADASMDDVVLEPDPAADAGVPPDAEPTAPPEPDARPDWDDDEEADDNSGPGHGGGGGQGWDD